MSCNTVRGKATAGLVMSWRFAQLLTVRRPLFHWCMEGLQQCHRHGDQILGGSPAVSPKVVAMSKYGEPTWLGVRLVDE